MNGDSGAAIILLLIIVLVYFLPSFAAAGKERNGGVFILNLFLGWTLIGWVVALAWAASLERKKAAPDPAPSPSVFAAIGSKRCPFCAEDIKPDAIVCKHCRRDLPVAETSQPTA